MKIALNSFSGEKGKARWLPYLALNVPVRLIFSQLEYLVKSKLLNYLLPQFIPEFESPHCISIRSICLSLFCFFLFSPPFLSLSSSSFPCKQQYEKAGDSGGSSLPAHGMDDMQNVCLFLSYTVSQYQCSRLFSLKPLTIPSLLWKATAQPICHFWCVWLKNDNI